MAAIEPQKFYSLHEICELGLLENFKITVIPTLKRYIALDKGSGNRLKVIKRGTGTSTRYYIKGEYIADFIEAFSSNQLFTEGGGKNGT